MAGSEGPRTKPEPPTVIMKESASCWQMVCLSYCVRHWLTWRQKEEASLAHGRAARGAINEERGKVTEGMQKGGRVRTNREREGERDCESEKLYHTSKILVPPIHHLIYTIK